jgi:hypothetical protein
LRRVGQRAKLDGGAQQLEERGHVFKFICNLIT